jgi:hypothetical protein
MDGWIVKIINWKHSKEFDKLECWNEIVALELEYRNIIGILEHWNIPTFHY